MCSACSIEADRTAPYKGANCTHEGPMTFRAKHLLGLYQEGLVAGEQVMLPQMQAEPGRAGDPDAMVGGIDRRTVS